MASNLLQCRVCPKQHVFSDTSHLLTHIGSKSHLAQLHHLKVRSQVDPEAQNTLDEFDFWYEYHDLNRLLSERMLQKQAKLINHQRKRIQKSVNKPYMEDGPTHNYPDLEDLPLPAEAMFVTPTKAAKKEGKDDDPSEEEVDNVPPLPDLQTECRSCMLLLNTPRSCSTFACLNAVTIAIYTPAKPMVKTWHTPVNMTPKGVVWPGMTMFDAASEATKAVRNQKKESSVFTRMQISSSLIQPTEVILSPGWTWMKARHIDELEDDISLVDGESPLAKKPTRKKPTTARSIAKNGRATKNKTSRSEITETKSAKPRSRRQANGMKSTSSFVQVNAPAPARYTKAEEDEALGTATTSEMTQLCQTHQFIDPRCDNLSAFDHTSTSPRHPLMQALLNPLISPPKLLSEEIEDWQNSLLAQALQSPLLHTIANGGFRDTGERYNDNHAVSETTGSTTPRHGSNPLVWHDDWTHDYSNTQCNPLNRDLTDLGVWSTNWMTSPSLARN